MAAISFFLIGPSLVLSLIGLLRGPDKTKPTITEDWRQAKVDVVIPAYNAQNDIDLCLASLSLQTVKPRKITIFDDGSKDKTSQFVKEFSERIGLEIVLVRREMSEGKTVSLRDAAHEEDGDVLFVLDSDTILASKEYIAEVVKELYSAIGIASVCGTVLPLTEKARSQLLADPRVGQALQDHFKKNPEIGYYKWNKNLHRFARFITNTYRDVLYKFLEKVIYRGEQALFGTMINPIGCAVAYRKKYIKAVFDDTAKTIGPDLTSSEDIYFGFAFSNEGYRNVQVPGVLARTLEPLVTRLPRQIFLWSSAFFQSNYLVTSLIKSPFKLLKKIKTQKQKATEQVLQEQKRKIQEPYRQAFGKGVTSKLGRPVGWFILSAAIEKILFPIFIILMFIFGWWESLILTFSFESLTCALLLFVQCKGERLKMAFKSICVAPIRYLTLFYDLLILFWFIIEVWVIRNRAWRK